MNRKINYLIFITVCILVLTYFNKDTINSIIEKTEKNKYLIYNESKTVQLNNFLQSNELLTYTYTVEEYNNTNKVLYMPENKTSKFYIRINQAPLGFMKNSKNIKIPLPLISKGSIKINKNLFTSYEMDTCDVGYYHPNTYYYNKLRGRLAISCLSKDQKTTIDIVLIENIGVIYFEISNLENGKNNMIYKVNLFSIKSKEEVIKGKDLYELPSTNSERKGRGQSPR